MARPCSCCGEKSIDPPTWVRFDGSGLKTNGYFCRYNTNTTMCETDLVTEDANGLKRYTAAVGAGSTCTGGTFIDFDGTGLKPTSQSSKTCVAVG